MKTRIAVRNNKGYGESDVRFFSSDDDAVGSRESEMLEGVRLTDEEAKEISYKYYDKGMDNEKMHLFLEEKFGGRAVYIVDGELMCIIKALYRGKSIFISMGSAIPFVMTGEAYIFDNMSEAEGMAKEMERDGGDKFSKI